MTSDQWLRIQELFHRALPLRGNERVQFLDAACQDDRFLRQELNSLLQYEDDLPESMRPLALAATRALEELELDEDQLNDSGLDNLVGKTVSHYRILEKIGSGGMGVVFKADDLKLHRPVAIKFLLDNAANSYKGNFQSADHDREFLDRSYQEARASSALDHPSICTVYEVDQWEGLFFIVMQLLVGEPLNKKIRERALPLEHVFEFGIQITDGLTAAHAAGVIHGDIKPANIFITHRGEAKIMDFGLARKVAIVPAAPTGDPEKELGDIAADMDIGTGAKQRAVGTAAYISPEQILGKACDERSDLFSFGAVLYEIATGVSPFAGDNVAHTLYNIVHTVPNAPSTSNPALPLGLDSIICKALQKDCGDRYQAARELRDDLISLRSALLPNPESASGASPIRRWTPLIVGIAVIFLCATSVLLLRRQRNLYSPPQGADNKVVLADFVNATGDPIFDETLKEGLRVQLEQSPFLNVLTDRQVVSELHYMERPPSAPLSVDIAKEICARTSGKAVIKGWIGPLGTHYVLRVSATSCTDDSSLGAEEVEVNSREKVLQGLSGISLKLRSRLGESLASIRKFDVPMEEATTPSLEALRAYSVGVKVGSTEGKKAAIPFFERAISIDPRFAMAYARLGAAYVALNTSTLPIAAFQKAHDLSGHVSGREKYYIDSHYYDTVTGNQNSVIQVFKLWQQTYPQDATPYTNLGVTYGYLGKHAEAIRQESQALRLEPSNSLIYANLASEYLNVGDIEGCKRIVAEAQQHKVSNPVFTVLLYQIAFLHGDATETSRLQKSVMGEPWVEGWMLATQADTEASLGHLSEARSYSAQAIASSRRDQDHESTVGYMTVEVLREAEFGNNERATRLAKSLLRGHPSRWTRVFAALALARAGDVKSSQKIVNALTQQFPDDTILNLYWIPTVRAAIDLKEGRPDRAIRVLQVTMPYELGNPKTPTNVTVYPIYMRGLAYLASNQGEQAAGEFKKILDHRGLVGNFPLGAFARLGIARAYQLKAERAGKPREDALTQSRDAYRDFLTAWKTADRTLPILLQAQSEWKRLSR